jgi:hypothetical protein
MGVRDRVVRIGFPDYGLKYSLKMHWQRTAAGGWQPKAAGSQKQLAAGSQKQLAAGSWQLAAYS